MKKVINIIIKEDIRPRDLLYNRLRKRNIIRLLKARKNESAILSVNGIYPKSRTKGIKKKLFP